MQRPRWSFLVDMESTTKDAYCLELKKVDGNIQYSNKPEYKCRQNIVYVSDGNCRCKRRTEEDEVVRFFLPFIGLSLEQAKQLCGIYQFDIIFDDGKPDCLSIILPKSGISIPIKSLFKCAFEDMIEELESLSEIADLLIAIPPMFTKEQSECFCSYIREFSKYPIVPIPREEYYFEFAMLYGETMQGNTLLLDIGSCHANLAVISDAPESVKVYENFELSGMKVENIIYSILRESYPQLALPSIPKNFVLSKISHVKSRLLKKKSDPIDISPIAIPYGNTSLSKLQVDVNRIRTEMEPLMKELDTFLATPSESFDTLLMIGNSCLKYFEPRCQARCQDTKRQSDIMSCAILEGMLYYYMKHIDEIDKIENNCGQETIIENIGSLPPPQSLNMGTLLQGPVVLPMNLNILVDEHPVPAINPPIPDPLFTVIDSSSLDTLTSSQVSQSSQPRSVISEPTPGISKTSGLPAFRVQPMQPPSPSTGSWKSETGSQISTETKRPSTKPPRRRLVLGSSKSGSGSVTPSQPNSVSSFGNGSPQPDSSHSLMSGASPQPPVSTSGSITTHPPILVRPPSVRLSINQSATVSPPPKLRPSSSHSTHSEHGTHPIPIVKRPSSSHSNRSTPQPLPPRYSLGNKSDPQGSTSLSKSLTGKGPVGSNSSSGVTNLPTSPASGFNPPGTSTPSNPQSIPSNPQSIPSNPQSIPSNPPTILSNPPSIPSDPPSTLTPSNPPTISSNTPLNPLHDKSTYCLPYEKRYTLDYDINIDYGDRILFAKDSELPSSKVIHFKSNRPETRVNLRVSTEEKTLGFCKHIIVGGLPQGKVLDITFSIDERKTITFSIKPNVYNLPLR